ncbi:DUF308 domain-containing protein [Candidatus Saccharibacteria bacterium]|nr:DUF308 domain-containing protein [Candidatus Saccharibacteria bacterium]
MKEISKKIKWLIGGAICISVIFIILGICFVAFPAGSLNIIRWILCVMALVMGISFIVADFSRKLPGFGTAAAGAILIVAGLALAFHPAVMNIFPVALGAWFIVTAISYLRLGFSLPGVSGIISILTALISLACGILLIINPWGGQISIMIFAGIMMIAYGVSSAISTTIFGVNLSDLEKSVKKTISGIGEAGKK